MVYGIGFAGLPHDMLCMVGIDPTSGLDFYLFFEVHIPIASQVISPLELGSMVNWKAI